MGKVKEHTIKDVLLRLISGAELIEKRNKYYLKVFSKGEIRIRDVVGASLINSGILREVETSENSIHYSIKFERLISDSVKNKRDEIRVFAMYMWKKKDPEVEMLVNEFEKNKIGDNYTAMLLYNFIKKEFQLWHEERQKYLRQIEGL